MQTGTESKCQKLCEILTALFFNYFFCILNEKNNLITNDCFEIHMSEEEFVDRTTPFAVEFFKTCGIPPILLKYSNKNV